MDSDLYPPTIALPQQTGLILEISAVGWHNPLAARGEPSYAYVRCTDGHTIRLPTALQEWATGLLAANRARRAAGEPSLLPARIEFGVLDDRTYAEILDPTEQPSCPAGSSDPDHPSYTTPRDWTPRSNATAPASRHPSRGGSRSNPAPSSPRHWDRKPDSRSKSGQ